MVSIERCNYELDTMIGNHYITPVYCEQGDNVLVSNLLEFIREKRSEMNDTEVLNLLLNKLDKRY